MKISLLPATELRRQWTPSENHLAARDVAVQIIMRQAAFGPLEAEILDRAMQRVGRQRPIHALALELLRAHLGAQVDREASAPAMLIERTGTHARTSQAQHDGSAVVAGRGEKLALEAIQT